MMEVSLTYKIVMTIALAVITFLLIGLCVTLDEKKRLPSQMHKFFEIVERHLWCFYMGLLGMGALYAFGFAWVMLITMWL